MSADGNVTKSKYIYLMESNTNKNELLQLTTWTAGQEAASVKSTYMKFNTETTQTGMRSRGWAGLWETVVRKLRGGWDA